MLTWTANICILLTTNDTPVVSMFSKMLGEPGDKEHNTGRFSHSIANSNWKYRVKEKSEEETSLDQRQVVRLLGSGT